MFGVTCLRYLMSLAVSLGLIIASGAVSVVQREADTHVWYFQAVYHEKGVKTGSVRLRWHCEKNVLHMFAYVRPGVCLEPAISVSTTSCVL